MCLLWSFKNPVNEQASPRSCASSRPSCRSRCPRELAPVYREYERMVTTVLDAACKPVVAPHFDELAVRAARARTARRGEADAGRRRVRVGHRGRQGPDQDVQLRPGRRRRGRPPARRALGLDNVVTADMGGTSFDAAVITGGEYRVLPRAEMGAFPTALTAVDISSIGAGGGSIAWMDARGLMRVGPHSAGSVPGPGLLRPRRRGADRDRRRGRRWA